MRAAVKKALGSRRGYSLVELTLVMLILAIFALTIVTLLQSGASAYENIISNRNDMVDARIAMSYINVRLQQNDGINAVFVRTNPINGAESIVIRENYNDRYYDSWIFFFDGELRECNLLDADAHPRLELSQLITRLEDFTVSYDDDARTITKTASYMSGAGDARALKTITNIYVLRSGEY